MDSLESVIKLLVDSMVDVKENIDDKLLASYHSGDVVMIPPFFLIFQQRECYSDSANKYWNMDQI